MTQFESVHSLFSWNYSYYCTYFTTRKSRPKYHFLSSCKNDTLDNINCDRLINITYVRIRIQWFQSFCRSGQYKLMLGNPGNRDDVETVPTTRRRRSLSREKRQRTNTYLYDLDSKHIVELSCIVYPHLISSCKSNCGQECLILHFVIFAVQIPYK